MITHQMRNILAQLSQDVALSRITWYPMGVVPPVMCGNMTILAERFAIRFKMATELFARFHIWDSVCIVIQRGYKVIGTYTSGLYALRTVTR